MKTKIILALCLVVTAVNAAETETGKRLRKQAEKYDAFAAVAETRATQLPEVEYFFRERALTYREVAIQFRREADIADGIIVLTEQPKTQNSNTQQYVSHEDHSSKAR